MLYFLANIILATAIGEKSFNACKTYGESMLECQNILGHSKVRVPIDMLLFPHMVLIGFSKGTEHPVWKCGGTLISDKWVLTAAHCKEDPMIGPASKLKIGTATFEFDEDNDLEQERNIAEFKTHPDYKPPSKYHDIALVKADVPFILSRDIRIACLSLDDDFPKANLIVTGFGVTRAGAAAGSQTLMTVNVDLIDNEVCNKSFKYMIKRKILSEGIKDTQICAGDYKHGGRDACQGDSGGPLQVMVDRVDCLQSFPLHKVVGVTSFGRDCGRRFSPGVYTKVSKYIEWIESIVWP